MRVSTCIATVLQMGLVLASSLQAQDSVTLSVSANMDIYRAGGYNDGSDGIAPVPYTLGAGTGRRTVTFPSVGGAWTCTASVPEYGADGTGLSTGCKPPGGANISNPIGTFSGYESTDFSGAMVGMFLENALPASAPPALRFYVSDSAQGGIQTDFRTLNPRIGQVFFIGDGLTGTGSGVVQVFEVPRTATRLYLGYVDSCNGDLVPSCYSDNVGMLSAVVSVHDYQLNWVEPQESVSPPGRCCMGMAYDPAMHATVIFGGETNPTTLGDTWTWTSRQGWSQLSPAASPSARMAPIMAYDKAAGNIVLFGGVLSNGVYLNDTWIWDGTTWTQQVPPVSPPVRQFGAMTYDAATQTVVLFGGLTTGFTPIGDTWTWDGLAKTWTQQFPASSPFARRTMMAYDNGNGTVVLFGGDNGDNSFYDDTWTWDGTTWTQQFPASAPSARGMSSMAYDPDLDAVVLFGGTPGAGGTWKWNGANWAELEPARAPAGRWAAGMDYDTAAGSLVLFSGYGTHTLDDTWLFRWVPVTP